ncbi:TlpA family protein disulfide reductase [Neorhodopirellula pilleata]|uniref:Thiol-disulfide oxidoreductase ResA n=1 Tax=Neorhodopirellula pilleata TaxID=2714738 RepID=A0A5C5ZLG6_9BACT|nr:TlpA disulfide reductase family protein [Neorhodopirellula pilleata]TWT88015.1 Thiol-disulfide oxidoreductase ResA [Neorhodopirellula pilleata]
MSPQFKSATGLVLLGWLACSGCGGSTEPAATEIATDRSAVSVSNDEDRSPPDSRPNSSSSQLATSQARSPDSPGDRSWLAESMEQRPDVNSDGAIPNKDSGVESLPIAKIQNADDPQLRADLTPTQLAAFLGEVDREMRGLINGQSGITDPQAIQSEVDRVVRLKRTASERLMNDPQADTKGKTIGRRGYLQAMSHLASMGDLASAEKLQEFAEQFRNDPNPELRSDSRLVLIGFAIESIRHGKEGAAKRVLQLMRETAAIDQPVDVATLMVMGQAKDTLLQYEHRDEATQVRQLILDRFAGSADPEVAKMAAMIAASGFGELDPKLQRLEELRMAIVDPPNDQAGVTAEQWGEAVDAVLEDSVDLLTVQFLAGMSLESEAIGRDDIADATYERLEAKVIDRQDAIGREARTAIQAKRNREAVIGQVFMPDLPTVDGQELSMVDLRGNVVLMPFWSGAFPDSLAVLPNLQNIQAQYPDRVAIVGMNLDLSGTDVRGFMKQNGLNFPSFRSESDPSADITNEVAYRFGAVSLIFVAIIDQDGKVVSVEFSGEDLTEKVEKLLR